MSLSSVRRVRVTTALATPLAAKVDVTAFDDAVTTLEEADAALLAAISGKASTGTVSALDTRVGAVESTLPAKADVASLDAAVAALSTDLVTAINNEQDGRVDADASLQAQISTEADNRLAGDEGLAADISIIADNIGNEIIGRQQADASLQEQILTEAENRLATDQSLAGDVDILSTQIEGEITGRVNADAYLQGEINLEAANRLAGDEGLASDIAILSGQIGNETVGRVDADAYLQAQLQLEADNRLAGDEGLASDIGILSNQIGQETNNRIGAINALRPQIDTLLKTQGAPGEAPFRFTASLVGSADAAPPITTNIVLGQRGMVVEMIGAKVVGTRERVALVHLRTLRVRYAVRRKVNAIDPLNDGIRLGIQWLNKSKAAIGQATVQVLNIVVSDGVTYATALISSAGSAGVTEWPSAATYMVPFVETFGSETVTHLELLEWDDVSGAEGILPPDFENLLAQAQDAADVAQSASQQAQAIIDDGTAAMEWVGGVGYAPDSVAAQISKLNYEVDVTTAPYYCPTDGVAPAIPAIQFAMNDVSARGGGIVWLPPILYNAMSGHLDIPKNVALLGRADGPFDHSALPDVEVSGPTFLVDDPDESPFQFIGNGGKVANIIVYYPNQVDPTQSAPVAFPPTFLVNEGIAGSTVEKCTLVNAYIGADIRSGRTTFKDNNLGCLHRDFVIDKALDFVTISNNKSEPFWDIYAGNLAFPQALDAWVMSNKINFETARVDSLNVTGHKIFGSYAVHLTRDSDDTGVANRSGYGSFIGCECDYIAYGVIARSVRNSAKGFSYIGCGWKPNLSGSGVSGKSVVKTETGGSEPNIISLVGGSVQGADAQWTEGKINNLAVGAGAVVTALGTKGLETEDAKSVHYDAAIDYPSGSIGSEVKTQGLQIAAIDARRFLAASATPAAIGEMVAERTSDTTLTFKMMGVDGVVRSGAVTLV